METTGWGKLAKRAGVALAVVVVFFLTACGAGTAKISLDPVAAELRVGETLKIAASVSDGSAVTWSTSDATVASVSADGTVTGNGAGRAVITAAAGGTLSTCTVTVKATVNVTVTISQKEARIEEGGSIVLAASVSDGSAVTWSTSDETVASVTQNGMVTGIAAGTATITAAAGDAAAVCAVTVTKKNTGAEVSISQTAAAIAVGETLTLTASASDGSAIAWYSNAPSVAPVDDGVVTALSPGTATITAMAGSKFAACIVTVSSDGRRTLVWSDEFEGTALDLTKWGYQTGTQDHYGSSYGPQYWGNNELQYYTEDSASVADGSLRITARKRAMGDRPYTSARLLTRDKGSWTYGYFEARMKTPALDGMWPAFWMLPQPSSPQNSANKYGTWAASGEIDIMEAKGRLKNVVDTTLHFGGNWPDNRYLTKATAMNADSDEWHVYALEWRETYMTWYVDDKAVYTLSCRDWYSASAPDDENAPFDQPFYILLDLAVGGNYDGGIQPGADFTAADMYVDYVRVYEYD